MNPYFLRPITPPQMMPYAFYRPPIPYAPVPQAPVQAAAGALGATGGGLNGFLANANALMTNAEKFTPYVQQLSPMMKNLPALWRMYKSFKSTPESSAVPTARMPVQQQRQNESPIQSIQRQPTNSPQPVPLTPRPSVPKIYQPTWPI